MFLYEMCYIYYLLTKNCDIVTVILERTVYSAVSRDSCTEHTHEPSVQHTITYTHTQGVAKKVALSNRFKF